jgi:hypothetical protein
MKIELDYTHYNAWFEACTQVATLREKSLWEHKNFYGILGDIKEKTTEELREYFEKRPGLSSYFARLYLTEGIGGGAGYQSCAALVFAQWAKQLGLFKITDRFLDIGTGVGTLPFALNAEEVHGFDRIFELVQVCQEIATLLKKKQHFYWCQDFLEPWALAPEQKYSHLCLGLVLHQLRDSLALFHLLRESFQALLPHGNLYITLPAQMIGSRSAYQFLMNALEACGFVPHQNHCGMIFSSDFSARSFFWMFVFHLEKHGRSFLSHSPSFLPVMSTLKLRQTRGKKRERIRLAVLAEPQETLHSVFRFISGSALCALTLDQEWDYYHLKNICLDFKN